MQTMSGHSPSWTCWYNIFLVWKLLLTKRKTLLLFSWNQLQILYWSERAVVWDWPHSEAHNSYSVSVSALLSTLWERWYVCLQLWGEKSSWVNSSSVWKEKKSRHLLPLWSMRSRRLKTLYRRLHTHYYLKIVPKIIEIIEQWLFKNYKNLPLCGTPHQ